jgi:hypothetical protein
MGKKSIPVTKIEPEPCRVAEMSCERFQKDFDFCMWGHIFESGRSRRIYRTITTLNPSRPGSFYLVSDRSGRQLVLKTFSFPKASMQQQYFFLQEIDI